MLWVFPTFIEENGFSVNDMKIIGQNKLHEFYQTQVCSPVSSKAHLLTPGCGEGKYSFIVKVPIEGGPVVVPQNPELP